MAITRSGDHSSLATQQNHDPFELVRNVLGWDPFREISRITGGEMTFHPTFEIRETKDSYVFKADLPGVKQDDLDVSLTGNRLTISGQREQEKRDEGDQYFTTERVYGSFARTFTLPDGIDSEHVKAELKDGVLTVAVPKKPEVQPKRISVSGSKSTDKASA